MRRLTSLLSLCLLIISFSACQEEKAPIKAPTYNPNIDLPTFNPKFPGSLTENGALDQAIPLNEHLFFRIPRFPRPRPCPRLAGCNLPMPEFLLLPVEGCNIQETYLELYTEKGELYASSSEEFGGNIAYESGSALVSMGVVDDQASSENLSLSVKVAYEVDGKAFVEEFFEKSVPVYLTEYEEAGSVMFRFPRFPRPRPCPVLAGCNIPIPELHVIVSEGSIQKLSAQLYTKGGELYACSGEECGSVIEYEAEEALAPFTIVNPEIETKSLNLALQITYEINGEVVSEEIHSENVPFDMY